MCAAEAWKSPGEMSYWQGYNAMLSSWCSLGACWTHLKYLLPYLLITTTLWWSLQSFQRGLRYTTPKESQVSPSMFSVAMSKFQTQILLNLGFFAGCQTHHPLWKSPHITATELRQPRSKKRRHEGSNTRGKYTRKYTNMEPTQMDSWRRRFPCIGNYKFARYAVRPKAEVNNKASIHYDSKDSP